MLVALDVDAIRNLAAQRLEFRSDLTLLVGRNAQGKSSLLEAAYLVATTKSFRTRDPREAIASGEEQLSLRAELKNPTDSTVSLQYTLGRGRGNRSLSVGEYGAKLVDYLGVLPALVLSGESGRAAAGSPTERRRYMDRATAAAIPEYIGELAQYKQGLKQRNRLLKQGAPDSELDPWDELLSRAGERVRSRRREQVKNWQEEIGRWPTLTPHENGVQLAYRSSADSDDDEKGSEDRARGEEELLEHLKRARALDRKLAVTTVGPHRDDLAARVDDRDLWKLGSAGQVRSTLAVLLLAQASITRRSTRGVDPILVLDDVDSDLDDERVAEFLSAARGEGQVIAATSKRAPAGSTGADVIEVEGGVATRPK